MSFNVSLAAVALLLIGLAHAQDTGTKPTKVLVEGTTCMDGTPAGYYYGAPPSADVDTAVIYLQGGGACFTKETCDGRANTDLGSSKKWAPTTLGNDILSSDPAVNKYFYNAHHIFIPYCTGDVHGGQRTTPSAASWGYHFSGHTNFVSIIKFILAHYASEFKTVKHVLISGGSAGGFGTFINADWLADTLQGIDVRGAPVGGWFFPNFAAGQPAWEAPSAYPCWKEGKSCGATDTPAVADLWQQYLHPDCAAAHDSSTAFHCMSVGNMYPFIKTPLFVMENVADTNQLLAQLDMPGLKDNSTVSYVKYFVSSMQASTAQVSSLSNKTADGLFLPSCFDHTGDLEITSKTSISGVVVGDALGAWYNKNSSVPRILTDSCSSSTHYPCNPTCNTAFPH